MKKQIAILGSTGSIGTQALEVIEEHSDLYEVYCLTANNKIELLAEQAHKFKPAAIVIANEARYDELKSLMSDMPDVKVYAGAQALNEIVEAGPINMVLTAMVGFAGLNPTIHAIKAGKTICLANKETLVVAGELILQLAQQYHTPILPVAAGIVKHEENPARVLETEIQPVMPSMDILEVEEERDGDTLGSCFVQCDAEVGVSHHVGANGIEGFLGFVQRNKLIFS